MPEVFENRREAGIVLASRLGAYAGRPDVIVLALPRGGVPVGHEVANALRAPLDVFLVRKLGLPGHPELAMGAIASGGIRVLNDDVIQWSGVTRSAVDAVTELERVELDRREREYRSGVPPVALTGRVVVLVDDGLATGSTMMAAIQAVRTQAPARIVVAVPVGAAAACARTAAVADEVVCARTPEPFSAVGEWYRDFSQTSDDEVRALLADQPGARIDPRDATLERPHDLLDAHQQAVRPPDSVR
jgi:putative phosphoribosyl transferase